MSYSCSDFTDDILSRLDSVAVKPLSYPDDDPEAQANAALDAITELAQHCDELHAACEHVMTELTQHPQAYERGTPVAYALEHARAALARCQ